MGRILMVWMVLALAGCQNAPRAAPMNTADSTAPVIPPAVSRPIVEPDGNVVQCTAYPGPGVAGDCVQK